MRIARTARGRDRRAWAQGARHLASSSCGGRGRGLRALTLARRSRSMTSGRRADYLV